MYSPVRFECTFSGDSLCGKTFLSNFRLIEHLEKIHFWTKLLALPIEITTTQDVSYQYTELPCGYINKNVLPYKICGKMVTNQFSLKRHMNMYRLKHHMPFQQAARTIRKFVESGKRFTKSFLHQ